MRRISGESYLGETVVLDGNHFLDCVLKDCVLEYSGQTVLIENTQFYGCSFSFKDEAARTVMLLESFEIIMAGQHRLTIGKTVKHTTLPN